MGGAINDAVKTITGGIQDIPVIGHVANAALTPITAGASLAAGADRAVQGFESGRRAPGEAREAADKARKMQSDQAADLEHQMLIKPKAVTPDNFLANKAAQLANLRLGMASTVAGSGQSAAGAGLTGDRPGKRTLGS